MGPANADKSRLDNRIKSKLKQIQNPYIWDLPKSAKLGIDYIIKKIFSLSSQAPIKLRSFAENQSFPTTLHAWSFPLRKSSAKLPSIFS